jgi:guanine nucleotide-binding protein G(i) subunit alpha
VLLSSCRQGSDSDGAEMGNCASAEDKQGKANSDAIDKQIEEDSRRYKKECKILLLGGLSWMCACAILVKCPHAGSGESGKSTVVKQMKIIHQSGFSSDEIASFIPIVYKNVVDSAKDIVGAMRKIGVGPVNNENRVSPPPPHLSARAP